MTHGAPWLVPAILVLLLLVVAVAVVYLVGEHGCPTPSWAFWRTGNYACVRAG